MHAEEYLDQLLDEHIYKENQFAPSDDEIAVSLAAARMLVQLQELALPAKFAHRLEGEIRIRARSQSVSQHIEAGRLIPFTPSQGAVPQPHRPLKRRAWVATVGAVAVLLTAFASLLTLSAHSLPGDPLSGLKQAENQWTLPFGGDPQSHADAAIGQLRSSILDLNTVVNEGRDDGAIQQALSTVSVWTNNSREAVSALSAGPALQTAQQSLDGALRQEDQTLRLLLNHVDWPMKVAFTRQLGMLGDPVPTVIHVTVRAQSNGTLLVTLTGADFASRTQLVIDGKPMGIVSQRSAGLLVATVSSARWSSGTHTVGVLNADGTAAAAQAVFHLHDREHNLSIWE